MSPFLASLKIICLPTNKRIKLFKKIYIFLSFLVIDNFSKKISKIIFKSSLLLFLSKINNKIPKVFTCELQANKYYKEIKKFVPDPFYKKKFKSKDFQNCQTENSNQTKSTGKGIANIFILTFPPK